MIKYMSNQSLTNALHIIMFHLENILLTHTHASYKS